MAAAFLGLGVLGLVVAAAAESNVVTTVSSIGFTILGLIHLASATALRRRDDLGQR